MSSVSVRSVWTHGTDITATPTVVKGFQLTIEEANAHTIHTHVKSPEHLEILVNQLEEMDGLSYADIHTLIGPLIQVCWLMPDKERAADIAERILLNCLARIPSDIAERFEEYEKTSDVSILPPFPSHAQYTKVMSMIADANPRSFTLEGKSRSEDAANRVNRIFRLLIGESRNERLYFKSNGKSAENYPVRSAEPSMSTFKALLRAWSVTGTAEGAEKAENVLVEMEELSGVRPSLTNEKPFLSIAEPDLECYNMVLFAYSRTNVRENPSVTSRALSLFRRMQQLSTLELDWFSYQALIQSVKFRINSTKEPLDDDIIVQLELIIPQLASMDVPLSFSTRGEIHGRAWAFGIVIQALLHKTKDEDRLLRAYKLVRCMVGELPSNFPSTKVSGPELRPTQQSLAALYVAWQKSQLADKEKALKWIQLLAVESHFQNLDSVHRAMDFWEDSKALGAPRILQSWLDRMLDATSPSESEGKNPRKVQQILQRIKEGIQERPGATILPPPNRSTFYRVIRSWRRSNESNRAIMVENLLDKMQNLNIYINEGHFCFLLETWLSLAKDGKRYPGKHGLHYPADHACLHLKDRLQRMKEWNPSNYQHFSTCMKAWVQQALETNDSNTLPVREVSKLLEVMENRSGDLPPAPLCNMVLQSCLRDDIALDQRHEAYSTALITFDKGRYDPVSFILVVEIVKRFADLLKEDPLQFIEGIVQASIDSGFLTNSLLYEAIEVLQPEQMVRLFNFSQSFAEMIAKQRSSKLLRVKGKRLQWDGVPPHSLMVSNMPQAWSRNSEFRKRKGSNL